MEKFEKIANKRLVESITKKLHEVLEEELAKPKLPENVTINDVVYHLTLFANTDDSGTSWFTYAYIDDDGKCVEVTDDKSWYNLISVKDQLQKVAYDDMLEKVTNMDQIVTDIYYAKHKP